MSSVTIKIIYIFSLPKLNNCTVKGKLIAGRLSIFSFNFDFIARFSEKSSSVYLTLKVLEVVELLRSYRRSSDDEDSQELSKSILTILDSFSFKQDYFVLSVGLVI